MRYDVLFVSEFNFRIKKNPTDDNVVEIGIDKKMNIQKNEWYLFDASTLMGKSVDAEIMLRTDRHTDDTVE